MSTRDQRIASRVVELERELGPHPTGSFGWTRWARATFEVHAEIRREQAEGNDPFGDPRTDEERDRHLEGFEEFAPCEGFPFGGWERLMPNPFFEGGKPILVRIPRLF